MNIAWRQIAPVAISVLVIILIAVLRAFSKTLAAVTATMPINIALALWIVFAAEGGDQSDVIHFTESMLVGVGATAIFLAAVWLAARAGWGLVPMLLAGYLAWGVALVLILGLQQGLAR